LAARAQAVLRLKVEETIAWLLREMRVEGGAFASSLDADSEGDEGKFYAWTEAEIDTTARGHQCRALQTGIRRHARRQFSARRQAHGRNILHRVSNLAGWTEAEEGAFAAQKRILLDAREKRVRPGRDDKVLVDWNV
jgi:uncharacterized protein YyaL (SSP411 family)